MAAAKKFFALIVPQAKFASAINVRLALTNVLKANSNVCPKPNINFAKLMLTVAPSGLNLIIARKLKLAMNPIKNVPAVLPTVLAPLIFAPVKPALTAVVESAKGKNRKLTAAGAAGKISVPAANIVQINSANSALAVTRLPLAPAPLAPVSPPKTLLVVCLIVPAPPALISVKLAPTAVAELVSAPKIVLFLANRRLNMMAANGTPPALLKIAAVIIAP